MLARFAAGDGVVPSGSSAPKKKLKREGGRLRADVAGGGRRRGVDLGQEALVRREGCGGCSRSEA